MMWNELTVGEDDSGYPKKNVLIAVQETYGVHVHIGCYFRQYEIEQHDDYGDDWGEYNEEEDQYFCPKGWYQEACIDEEYANCYIHYPVLAWAELPVYEGATEK